MAEGPLNGLKVIEMTGLAPAPYCAMLLADLGADVLRIDRPGAARAPEIARFDVLKRNRPAIELDLKRREDVARLLELVESAAVLIEGFRPGVMERLGLGPESCLERNPRLVYGRVTGWGQEGPMSLAAGHDVNYIALSGALHHIGHAGGPPVIPLNLVGDFAGGGLFLAFGIMCAVFEAGRSGKGQVVDAAMVDGAASLMSFVFGLRASGLMTDARGDGGLSGIRPHYTVYQTKDGGYVSVAASEPQFFSELIARLGLEAADEDRTDRSRWASLRARMAEVFLSKTRAEWSALLEGTDACFAPVLGLDEVAAHPHNRERKTFIEVAGVLQPAPAPRFGRTPAQPPKRRDHEDPVQSIARWREGRE